LQGPKFSESVSCTLWERDHPWPFSYQEDNHCGSHLTQAQYLTRQNCQIKRKMKDELNNLLGMKEICSLWELLYWQPLSRWTLIHRTWLLIFGRREVFHLIESSKIKFIFQLYMELLKTMETCTCLKGGSWWLDAIVARIVCCVLS